MGTGYSIMKQAKRFIRENTKIIKDVDGESHKITRDNFIMISSMDGEDI